MSKHPDVKHTQLFINNTFVDAVSGKTFATTNPANHEVLAHVAEAEAADVNKAVAAAKAAFKRGSAWRTMDASQRGQLLVKLAAAVERDASILAKLDSLDNGKTFKDALAVDVGLAIKCFRYYAGWADKARFYGRGGALNRWPSMRHRQARTSPSADLRPHNPH